ncbi:hypothetical protein Trydic_g8808 [Trypoxylus dichotomus]
MCTSGSGKITYTNISPKVDAEARQVLGADAACGRLLSYGLVIDRLVDTTFTRAGRLLCDTDQLTTPVSS